MKRFSFAAIAAVTGLLAGCSGASSDLLFDSGPQPQDDASSAPDAQAADGATGSDATTPEDATSSEDATLDGADATPDVHTGPPDSTIACGPQLGCSAQSEICCWHMGSTNTPYECVTSPSKCAGVYDVPMTCSSTDNCASQGNAGYQCCATTGNYGMGQCYGYDVATVVACKPSCDLADTEIGCSVQQQNCSDTFQTCIVSKCTVPGDTMCY